MTETLQIELSNYSLAELRSLSADVEREISAIEKSMVADARRRIQQIALQAELTLEELVEKPRQNDAPTSIYANPDDETQTWAGRGRKPAWLKTWLDCGISLEELRRQEAGATRQKGAAN
jgi:DNA-binding protein H-NS